MTVAAPAVAGEFIDGSGQPLAAVTWRPPPGEPVRFGVLHVPPGGDELNKSRRMTALQARTLARRGAVVVLADLTGTGDSGGEHADATWSGWQDDVTAAWRWLRSIVGPAPMVLWGTRLGALLATELVSTGRIEPAALLLWQPVVNGRTFFGQWLRLADTQQLAGAGDIAGGAKSARARLASGRSVEIGGYELHPKLVSGAEAVDLASLTAPSAPVVWREMTLASPPAVAPASLRVQNAWDARQSALDFAAVQGPSFWATQELAEAPELIAASTDALIRQLSRSSARPS